MWGEVYTSDLVSSKHLDLSNNNLKVSSDSIA